MKKQAKYAERMVVKMKLKYIPNVITIARFILTASLIFIAPLSPASKTIFVIAGVSDMIDGQLARRIKDAQSELGAELDSIADLFMALVGVFVLLPAMNLWSWIWGFIPFAIGFKCLSAVSGIVKHRKVFFLHTLSNKFLAMILFLGGILYFIFGGVLAVNIYFAFLIASVFLITLEEIVIISLLDYPHKNIKGFWQIRKVNEEHRKTISG